MHARLIAALLALLALATTASASDGSGKLPPETRHGQADRLHQYPAVSLATPEQRASARRLLAEMRAAAREWRDPRAASAAGFDTRTARRRPGVRTVGYLHAEHARSGHDRRFLNPARPKALIYANVPGRPLVLIGMMFAMPRGRLGPTPGGPITRWHRHVVCARGARRGLAPGRNGSCPPGWKKRQGSEMLHAWFTRDLRSAYAIHAPVPELCVAGLLSGEGCPKRTRRPALRCSLPERTTRH